MMASRKKCSDSSRHLSKSARRHVGEVMFPSSSSSEEEVTTGHRGCRNTSKQYFWNRVETESQAGQSTSKTEENPFSFKHFLKNGSQTNYQNAGARPKVYTSATTYNLEKGSAVYPRNRTELPDFVQDHLVIEQYYLNHEPKQQTISDVDNLPDFTLNSIEQWQTRLRNESKKSESSASCDLSFDLTESLDKTTTQRTQSVPKFLLDLPISTAEPDSESNVSVRDCPHSGTSEANVPKSLPDFLNDGPIHNRTTLSTESGSIPNSTESTERRLLLENERLRQELDLARKQINEKSEKIELLKSELSSKREVEHEEAIHLEKAMEQVEDNLKRSTRRAVNAESIISSLKKEIISLKMEISLLRSENKELRAGVTAGSKNECGSSDIDQTVKRVASDLRHAASSAEVSLRQLMFGVSSLRVLASALENMDRIEDRTKNFLPDYDEDNAAGPAL
ncbi:Serologically defined colon cancer antigen 3 like protein [Eufriesea mexicana]|uniref:Endosome-associated-trafficking regulator 1 n=1 Tax=Eufriesea mexicana TaxID=516756 RepID=A0A310SNR7_9HYME|nr:Serologically defined colon cancer antigen 3 like protein [Eufriesea mexicana]